MIIEFSITDPTDLVHTSYFKILGRNGTYEVRIKTENRVALFETSSCTCKFGSFWGQTKENKKNGKICSHLNMCLNFLEREGWISERKNTGVLKQNGKTKE